MREKAVRSAKLLRSRFVAAAWETSEIILTREMDKAQSFVHDKTRSPWNRRDRWWFLNGATVTYTGRRECMHRGRDDLPANLAEHRAGVWARRWRKFTRRAREQKTMSARALVMRMCVVSAICMKFQHRLSPSSVFIPESTESEFSASGAT